MDIKFDNKTPIYLQIMDLIKKDIIKGKLKEGDKLPSVRELSSDLKVNPNTIQRSLRELEREGLTYTQRGKGRFVTEDKGDIEKLKKEVAKEHIESFIKGMKQIGFNSKDIIKMVKDNVEKEEN
ncbi:MAG: GntR family transcriptional regulator [Firmicutes bacterium]|nr:GntR family transcriptional regulator [Bacillota bacterium]